WYSVAGQECNQFCASNRLVSQRSPEGAMCASGEIRPASALQQRVNFAYGVWPDSSPHYNVTATSSGRYCYNVGQGRDNDRTDLTVGCYCSNGSIIPFPRP